jgi:hypothetical protein
MLMYGNFHNIIDSGIVYNFTSFREGYIRTPLLVPPNEIGRSSGREFDIAYANYLMGNDFVFKSFFDIVYTLYTGMDVYLIVDESDWSENLIESLLKLIQQRYGYNAVKINCFEDYLQANNSRYISEFNTQYGLANLDMDKERYTYFIESERIRNGGNINGQQFPNQY